MVATLVSLAAARAHADPTGVPLTYAVRPLTLPAGILRLDGSFAADTDQETMSTVVGGSSISSPITQTYSVLTLGLAVGLTDNLEFSAHEPIQIGPSPASNDPYARIRYRLVRGAFEMAAEVTGTFPADSDGVGVAGGLPMLVRVSNVGRFDFIPRFGVDFIHPVAPTILPKEPAQGEFQAYYQHQLSEGFTFGLHAAVIATQFQSGGVQGPLGVLGRLSLPRSDGTAYADIALAFDFNRLFNGDVSAYTIGLAGRLFLPL